MIAIITEEQKNILLGRTYDGTQYFNPIKDDNNNWVISEEEIKNCNNHKGIEFIHKLTLTEYNK